LQNSELKLVAFFDLGLKIGPSIDFANTDEAVFLALYLAMPLANLTYRLHQLFSRLALLIKKLVDQNGRKLPGAERITSLLLIVGLKLLHNINDKFDYKYLDGCEGDVVVVGNTVPVVTEYFFMLLVILQELLVDAHALLNFGSRNVHKDVADVDAFGQ
jgi:hypothetical protein